MSPMLYANLYNGFSGVQLYFGFYFSLYNVLNTVFSLGFWLLWDQDVAFDEQKYHTDDEVQEIP